MPQFTSSHSDNMIDPSRIEVLLFDLGGVLIDIDFDCASQRFASLSRLSQPDFEQAFCVDECYEQYERGEISSARYFSYLKSKLQLEADDAQILSAWNAFLAGVISESLAAISRVRGRFPCYVLSNSNTCHQEKCQSDYPEVLQAFDRIFVSSELGMRKPEPAIFHTVADAIGAKPESILFFDDRLENVQSAGQVGFQTVHVHAPNDLCNALRSVEADLLFSQA